MDPERSLESGPQPSQAMPAVQIRYVGIGQLTLYLVSEDELRMIETGGPSATLLNLAVGFLFLAAGLLGSLLLSEPSKSIYKFNVFVILLVCSFIAGGVLLIVWSPNRMADRYGQKSACQESAFMAPLPIPAATRRLALASIGMTTTDTAATIIPRMLRSGIW